MYKDIPIYAAEADAGLSEVINSEENRCIASLCPVLLDKDVLSSVKSSSSLNACFANKNEGPDFDLHKIYAILATTGWNRNDDVFDSTEMWSARNTAEDKPFNKGHNPKDIIGHITGNAVVDENYELVKNDSNVDSLPKKFHVLTSAVIYKHVSSRDEDLTLLTKGLLQEIAEGKWFVSMEALFSNFDYALMDSEGSQVIVERNESTAFLTKHLRSYGGVGEYDGSRVGRIMRNITFSGKGLVENPGNPESIIFTEEDNIIFDGVANSSPKLNLLVTSSSKGESSMSDNNEQVRALESQVEKLEARLKELDEEKVQAQISSFEKACADKDAEISDLNLRVEAANEILAESKKSCEDLVVAKEESEKAISELTEKLEAIEASAVRASRISALVDVNVDKADAEVLVDTFESVSDEQFDAIVSLHADHKKKKAEEMQEEEEKSESEMYKDDEKKKKEDEAKSMMKKKYAEKADDSDAEEAAEASSEEIESQELLDNAEAEECAALAAQGEDDTQTVIASLNEYFGEVLGTKSDDNKES